MSDYPDITWSYQLAGRVRAACALPHVADRCACARQPAAGATAPGHVCALRHALTSLRLLVRLLWPSRIVSAHICSILLTYSQCCDCAAEVITHPALYPKLQHVS